MKGLNLVDKIVYLMETLFYVFSQKEIVIQMNSFIKLEEEEEEEGED